MHLKGTFLTTRAASIHWRQAREGHYRLINFSSASGLHGSPGQPNYAAAKMGIVGFTWSCANGLARYGVTANAIAPGAATRMLGGTPFSSREDDPQWSPDNVAPPLVYLASKESDWLTGRVIGVRGYQIQLYNNPAVIRSYARPGPGASTIVASRWSDRSGRLSKAAWSSAGPAWRTRRSRAPGAGVGIRLPAH